MKRTLQMFTIATVCISAFQLCPVIGHSPLVPVPDRVAANLFGGTIVPIGTCAVSNSINNPLQQWCGSKPDGNPFNNCGLHEKRINTGGDQQITATAACGNHKLCYGVPTATAPCDYTPPGP